MSSYLLLETGDKIVLEDDSGFLLLDEIVASVAGTVTGGVSLIGSVSGGVSLVGSVTGGVSVG